jgi:hypothetical protein
VTPSKKGRKALEKIDAGDGGRRPGGQPTSSVIVCPIAPYFSYSESINIASTTFKD